MAEDKKNFLQGKMNQDVDDRILPNGEYRSAQNIQVTTSQGSDVGSIQNISGNTLVDSKELSQYSDLETIGAFFDEKNNRIFYFVTNYTCPNVELEGLLGDDDGPTTAEQSSDSGLFCAIVLASGADVQQQELLPNVQVVVSGLFLNFSKNRLITGVNLLENLLFFTDGFNQPRKINVTTALSDSSHYDKEDKISVAKFAPFMPPLLLDYDTTTLNGNIPTDSSPTSSMTLDSDFSKDFIKEKFVRFSYRYRFADGEYSTIAPFTQVCFIPKTTSYSITDLQKVFKKGEIYFQDNTGISDGMVNSINSVKLNIILPSKNLDVNFDITAIEILYKESDNNLIRAVDLIDLNRTNTIDGVFQYQYKSTLPYKTLPKDQLTRVYDKVPLSAKAQEIISNRVVYGNYVENRKLPNQTNLNSGLNFSVGVSEKYNILNESGNSNFNNYYQHLEYPFHSIKQRRTYEVGVVLSDKFGRQSPVLTSTLGTSSITIAAKDENFHSSSWSSTNSTISDTSPGNANYCGDALTITFNESIPNSYAKATKININLDNNGSPVDNPSVLVTPEQVFSGFEDLTDTTFAEYKLKISDTTLSGLISIGDYLKGQDKDFVEVISVSTEGSNLVIGCQGRPSLSYKNYTGDISNPTFKAVENYFFNKYEIIPHGWYSYRVVVKQPEQEYYNVYSPGAISFDNDRDEDKTYIPIVSDSINKITRDVEFTSTQEEGLSTSKNRIYPKVIPANANDSDHSATDAKALSKQSDADLLDVISIGTAKEQGLKNDNEDVLSFVYESDKNPLMAQIPYGSDSTNIGTSTATGLVGSSFALTVGTTAGDKSELTLANKVLSIPQGAAGEFSLGEYLKGANKDLVKIIKITSADPLLIECDGAISDDYKDVVNDGSIKKYTYKYGVQDKISIFETKPFESVLDIYYETSTAGLVHELNEVVDFATVVKRVDLIDKNFSEAVDYQNTTTFDNDVATLQFFDNFGNEITFGTASAQIPANGCEIIRETAIFHPNLTSLIPSEQTNKFEVYLDTAVNKFKIRVIANRSENNAGLAYVPQVNPVKYNFQLKVTNNSGEEAFLFINDFELENVAPNITSSNNTGVVIAGAGDVVYEFEVDNGSYNGDERGLFFVNQNTNGLSEQTTSIGFIDGEGATRDGFAGGNPFDDGNYNNNVKKRTILTDTSGTPIPELSINNQTGKITLTEFFKGSLNVSVNIAVIDSLDPGIIESGGNEDLATLGGKTTIHLLNLIVADGLIVLETSNPQHVNETNATTINIESGNTTASIDIFDQTSNDEFNNYWTQSQTQTQISAGMSFIPQEQAGLFLYSRSSEFVSSDGPRKYKKTIKKKAFALEVIDSVPKIKIYKESRVETNVSGPAVGTYIYYTNNWREDDNGHIFITNNGTLGDVDGIKSEEQVGGNGAGDFGTDLGLVPLQNVDLSAELWDPNRSSQNELYGTRAGAGSGAFKVYNNEGTVTTSIAAAQNRVNSNNNDRLMKTWDTIDIGAHTYNVLYEVEDDRGRDADIVRVFLCKAPD
jgi:hypothetical protein